MRQRSFAHQINLQSFRFGISPVFHSCGENSSKGLERCWVESNCYISVLMSRNVQCRGFHRERTITYACITTLARLSRSFLVLTFAASSTSLSCLTTAKSDVARDLERVEDSETFLAAFLARLANNYRRKHKSFLLESKIVGIRNLAVQRGLNLLFFKDRVKSSCINTWATTFTRNVKKQGVAFVAQATRKSHISTRNIDFQHLKIRSDFVRFHGDLNLNRASRSNATRSRSDNEGSHFHGSSRCLAASFGIGLLCRSLGGRLGRRLFTGGLRSRFTSSRRGFPLGEWGAEVFDVF
mmetsp:Transcript_8502/g.16223  ORF Transcript_8502/g.16223 Transcript_8502/m.16223 type:complete len:296 (+) Transcript_8502:5522-6409(+)